MKLQGIKDLVPFLNHLRNHKLHFFLQQMRNDSVMLTITVAGRRIELDFFGDHIEYSVFNGTEVAHDDQDALFAMLSEHDS